MASSPQSPTTVALAPFTRNGLMKRIGQMTDAPIPYPAKPTPQPAIPSQSLTDIEYVANALWVLRYGDMKIVAQEILGKDSKPEDATALADKLYAFADRKHSP